MAVEVEAALLVVDEVSSEVVDEAPNSSQQPSNSSPTEAAINPIIPTPLNMTAAQFRSTLPYAPRLPGMTSYKPNKPYTIDKGGRMTATTPLINFEEIEDKTESKAYLCPCVGQSIGAY